MWKIEDHPRQKSEICNKILRALPKWFGIEESIVEYVQDVVDKEFLTLYSGERAVGFCALKYNYQVSCELLVLGILPEYHGLGWGRKMIAKIESLAAAKGCQFLSVKTLSERHPDVHYTKTREFYKATGFLPFEEFPDLWGEANPCLLMIKPIQQSG